MAGRWRLADGLSLTHLENGGWTVADLRRLSVYELDEDKGALIHHALKDPPPAFRPPWRPDCSSAPRPIPHPARNTTARTTRTRKETQP